MARARSTTTKSPDVPTDANAKKELDRHVELGDLGDLADVIKFPGTPRYVVTYMNSQKGGRIQSATIVTVTNQSPRPNIVTVLWFKGLTSNNSPVGMTVTSIPPDFTLDFASRNIPSELTVVNAVCNPELVFDEGRAIVGSRQPEIAVSSRVYYTAGRNDADLLAITDSKVVRFDQGNAGD
ncbi:MAG TPA: hypothetical protein VFK62_07190 [Gaiellaceae bacterium]|nr:hypothetical protein [Gaiellaceae bacterium]